jgi:hypothetical protein
MVEYNGQSVELRKLAKDAGLATQTVIRRLELGWGLEEALTRPLQPGHKHGPKPGNATQGGSMPKGQVTMVEYKGQKVELRKLARDAGLPINTVQQRLHRGKSLEEALATPRRPSAAPAAPAIDDVVAILTRLGFDIEGIGHTPAGRLILVKPGRNA